MKKFISLEIGPNYQKDDAFIALKTTLGIQNKTARKFVENWFLKRFQTNNIWFFSTCRGGLYSILKSLELEKNTEVLVQGFSCIVVPNAVLQANLKPVVCDVSIGNFNFDLEQTEAKITKNTKVWILQYNFGIIPDMQKVKEICEKYQLILIEDCAHSLGAEFEIDGEKQMVGNFGHVAAFSFGRDKIISTTTGGAVIFNPKPKIQVPLNLDKIIKTFSANHEILPEMKQKQTLQNLLYAILTPVLIKPLYHFSIGKIVALISTRLVLTGRVYDQNEKHLQIKSFPEPQKYSPKLYPLLFNQLKKLDYYNRHRKNIAKIYAQNLNLEYNPNNVYLRFPVYLAKLTNTATIDTNRQIWNKIYANARKQGYFLGNWYTRVFLGTAVDDQKTYDYNLKDLKNTAILIQKQVLNLPTTIDTSEKTANKILQVILTK